MAVQAAVNSDNLAGEEAALVGAQIHAHIGDISRAAITGNHDVVEEDVLQNLRNLTLVVGGDNQARLSLLTAA